MIGNDLAPHRDGTPEFPFRGEALRLLDPLGRDRRLPDVRDSRTGGLEDRGGMLEACARSFELVGKGVAEGSFPERFLLGYMDASESAQHQLDGIADRLRWISNRERAAD